MAVPTVGTLFRAQNKRHPRELFYEFCTDHDFNRDPTSFHWSGASKDAWERIESEVVVLESIQVLHHRFQDCYTSLSVPSHPLHFNEVEHEDNSPTSVSTWSQGCPGGRIRDLDNLVIVGTDVGSVFFVLDSDSNRNPTDIQKWVFLFFSFLEVSALAF